jgi:hypothetical protein
MSKQNGENLENMEEIGKYFNPIFWTFYRRELTHCIDKLFDNLAIEAALLYTLSTLLLVRRLSRPRRLLCYYV